MRSMNDETTKPWKNGRLKEIRRSMFSDSDSFQQALDELYEMGFCDDHQQSLEEKGAQ